MSATAPKPTWQWIPPPGWPKPKPRNQYSPPLKAPLESLVKAKKK